MHPPTETPDLNPILEYIYKNFYKDLPRARYYEDRKMLLYALTWPAHWLAGRSLRTRPEHYRRLLLERLEQILRHGDRQTYRRYFPRYLLKALQGWFHHHGDELYEQLKHASYTFEWLVKTIENPPPSQPVTQTEHTVEILAKAHHMLRPPKKKNRALRQLRQTELFD